MAYAYSITKESLTLLLGGKTYAFPKDSLQFKQLTKALKTNAPEAELQKLLTTSQVIKKYSDGELTIMSDDSIHRKGKPLPPVLATRVLECFNEGVPYQNLLNFFDRCNANPDPKIAIGGLYKFLEHNGMPITPKGTVLGYRGVTKDFKDRHSNTFDNSVGAECFMNRNDVEYDPDRACGPGLHIGSLAYATSWGSGGHVVIVEFDPADVVSVPIDYNFQKLRCSRFKVVALFEGAMPNTSVPDASNPYQGYDDDDDEDDEDDGFDICFY